MATLLLKHNAGTNARHGKYQTFLNTAAYFSNVEVAKLLVECNVGIKARDGVEQRRLHTAAYYGSSQVVILLLEHKADTIERGLDKEIPLHSSV